MYTTEGKVRYSEVDINKKITVPAIINYFQDCSIFQSEEIGLGFAYLEARKRAWILSSWQIEVKRRPGLSEAIRVGTWATGFTGLYGYRNFVMEDSDGERTAYANSIWVLMDLESGRPVKPEGEDVDGYEVLPAIEMETVPRKIRISADWKELPSFPVRKYHIDTNSHVNNCQYIQMALEALQTEQNISKIRVEYKNAAVYGDIIYPRSATEGARTVVELCNVEGRPFAVVEFRGEE